MRNYSFLWIMVLALNTSAIASDKPFVIKLKGNTLYRESVPEKPLTGTSVTKKNELIIGGANQEPKDTSGQSNGNSAVQLPDRSGYITLQSHCLDEDSLNPLDSVVMDVYSNTEHITAGISDKSGFITTDSIPPGNYYVVFYRNNYKSATTFLSRTHLNSKLYMDIPLRRKEKYLYDSVGQRIWKQILSLESIPIFLVILLIIFLYKKVITLAI